MDFYEKLYNSSGERASAKEIQTPVLDGNKHRIFNPTCITTRASLVTTYVSGRAIKSAAMRMRIATEQMVKCAQMYRTARALWAWT